MTTHEELPIDLETIDDPGALRWAAELSEATESDYRDEGLTNRIRALLDADDRIPFVVPRGDYLYNFWRDGAHPAGLWRRCQPEAYLAGEPAWEVLVDVDKLGEEEGTHFVWRGAQVREPDNDRALIMLSRGGADAVVVREFDLAAAAFVTEDPFELPEAKSSLSWLDRDTLLVGTDLGPDSVTESGYPLQTRLWRRGTALDQAPVVSTGERSDVAAGAWADTTVTPPRLVHSRALDFYSTREWIADYDPAGELTWRELPVPDDCETMIRGDLVVLLPRTEFAGLPAGGCATISLAALLAGDLDEATVVFTPSAHTALGGLRLTRDFLVLTVLDDVATVVYLAPLTHPDQLGEPLALPKLATASIVAASPYTDEIWLSTSSFTEPTTLWRLPDAADRSGLAAVRHAPARFDATGMETRQLWATSSDGTQIPYFIVGRFGAEGEQPTPRPTLVTAYGGFEVSLPPAYLSVTGVAWLERGGYLVQANLRGGGEFGPEWHRQVVGRRRRLVYRDHQAVLADLIRRGYATADSLAIRGGSNGGLLTSVALTQYPELFAAAVIQVPLTDMLRFHRWSAGASWMGEYGNPDDPEDRRVLESYSPLHNVVPSDARPYPPALVTTSTRDDRVHPAHARLFTQALKEAGQPVDYFENSEGGHAGAADNAQTARVESLIFSWLYSHVGAWPTAAE